MKEMVQRVKTKYGEVSWDYVRPFDALWVLTQAIEAAGSLDTDAVTHAWENLSGFNVLEGTGTMGGEQTYGIKRQAVIPFAITRIEGARLNLIKWVTPSIP